MRLLIKAWGHSRKTKDHLMIDENDYVYSIQHTSLGIDTLIEKITTQIQQIEHRRDEMETPD